MLWPNVCSVDRAMDVSSFSEVNKNKHLEPLIEIDPFGRVIFITFVCGEGSRTEVELR